jgi:hypothetical protein
VQLNYDRAGRGEPLVLIHGIGSLRTQYATACPPTSTTERSAVRGPSCTRTRSTSSLDSGVAAATTSAQRPRCAAIHPGPGRKAGEHLVLLTQLRPSLLTRRERPRVLLARPLLLSGACNLVQPGFLFAGHPRPCYRRWERRSPGSSHRRCRQAISSHTRTIAKESPQHDHSGSFSWSEAVTYARSSRVSGKSPSPSARAAA